MAGMLYSDKSRRYSATLFDNVRERIESLATRKRSLTFDDTGEASTQQGLPERNPRQKGTRFQLPKYAVQQLVIYSADGSQEDWRIRATGQEAVITAVDYSDPHEFFYTIRTSSGRVIDVPEAKLFKRNSPSAPMRSGLEIERDMMDVASDGPTSHTDDEQHERNTLRRAARSSHADRAGG